MFDQLDLVHVSPLDGLGDCRHRKGFVRCLQRFFIFGEVKDFECEDSAYIVHIIASAVKRGDFR